MNKKIDIDPSDIFGSTLHMVAYADHFSAHEIQDLAAVYYSMREIEDPGVSMARFEVQLYNEHFEMMACPNCGEEGYFKWLVLGRHRHAECGHNWMESPWRTIWENIKRLLGPARPDVKGTMVLSSVLIPLQIVLYYVERRNDGGGRSTSSG